MSPLELDFVLLAAGVIVGLLAGAGLVVLIRLIERRRRPRRRHRYYDD